VIRVAHLHKRFVSGRGRRTREVVAVDGVDFSAVDGAITALLGPNGAGKTTTLRVAAGLLEADSGSVTVDGIDVARRPRAALARLGVLSDARGLYPRLTARENIVYYGRLHGLGSDEAAARAEALAGLLEMVPLLDRRTEGFSQGERMKTALARALVHDPPNIVLDEPTNGLDVLATRSLRGALLRLRAGAGKCIVFSTHIMQEVQRLADRVVLVAHGRKVAEGTVDELCALAGEGNFEDAFVKLAFTADERAGRTGTSTAGAGAGSFAPTGAAR
jgi:sodium transport system ATP-binding protein